MSAIEPGDQLHRQRAIDPLRSFCVTAPAGSGKTELLIQRFLTLLARVNLPQEVLAITFTRKAAAEMQARVVAALEAAQAEQSPAGAHHALTWRLARAALDNDRKQGWNLLQGPTRLNIKTIDGYCAHLARQLPVLSGFGGPVAPVDDAGSYYLLATRAMLELLESKHPVAADLASILLHFDNNWPRLELLLVSMLARRDQWLGYIGVNLHAETAEKSLQRTVRMLVQDRLESLHRSLAAFQGAIMESLDYSRSNLHLPALGNFPGASQEDLADWRALADLVLTDAGSWRKQINVRQGFPPGSGADKARASARKQQLQSLLAELQQHERLQEELATLRHLPDIGGDQEAWQTMLALCRVLPVLAAQLSVVFQQHGVVDHAQVAMAAREALGGDEAPTDLAQKLDYTLRHILLDEFQDTAINQFELVRRLTRGWREDNQANPGNPKTLFIVGDGMQSIYGFRDADVGLFIKARQQGFNGVELEALDLSSNFRSDAPLVDWVNQVFPGAFPGADNLQRGEIAFSASMAQRPASASCAVQLLAFSGEEDQARVAEAERLASEIAAGVADPGCESIAVLVRNRKHLVPIVQALKARNIAWQAQDIDSLAESSVVVDLLSLCRALHNQADTVAWLALLRAPWCGLNLSDLLLVAGARGEQSLWTRMQDPQLAKWLSADGMRRLSAVNRILRAALNQRQRLPLRQWIEQTWLALGGAASVLRTEQLADAREFMNLLEDLERRGESYLPTLLEQRVARLYSQDCAAASKVQLMTLHKSKGLEFDWVIIPGLSRTPMADSRHILAWTEYHSVRGETGFLLAMDDQDRKQQRTLYNYLNQVSKRKRELEATRLMYVGCTRARKRLTLSATLTPGAETGSWKSPSSRSLLHCIWAGFKTTCLGVAAGAASPQSPRASAGVRRLKNPPAAPPAADPPTPRATNKLPQRPDNALQQQAGSVIHITLQRLSRYTEAELRDFSTARYQAWWRRQLQALGLAGENLEQGTALVQQSIVQVLSDARGRWLLAREREDAHSEYALSCLREDGRLVEHIIDRSFVEDGVRWVVDFKSATPAAGESLDSFLQRQRERYLPQLRRYRDAWAGLEGVPVKTALYFTSMAHWLECE